MTKQEKDALYQQYLESKLSVNDFAAKNNVSPAVIRGLISFHKRIESGEKSDFIRISSSNIKKDANEKTLSFKLDNHLIEIDPSLLKLFLGAMHD